MNAVYTLADVAHARTGDKGDVSSIAVIAWAPPLYRLLVEQVTEDAVRAHHRHRRLGSVRRYLLPRLHAMNLVLEDALDGGVNSALNLDAHGKSFAFFLLTLPIEVPPALRGLLKVRHRSLLDSSTPLSIARSLS
jgi:hypothetical protein